MSFKSLVYKTDAEILEGILRSCKKPSIIETPKQAFEAWMYYQRCLSKARSAFRKYMQSGRGSNPQHRHHQRWTAYETVVDLWADAIEEYFKKKADSHLTK